MISRVLPGLAAALLSCAPAQDRTSGEFQIRLTTAITTYAPAGAEFRAAVIGPSLPNSFTLPRGTLIRGVVREVRAVGLGFRRERAWLELDFRSCDMPDGNDFPCRVQLLSIDNARETVGSGNRVTGILAASHPHSWFNGIWSRPGPNLARRALFGLNGAAGVVQSRLVPSPAGAVLVLASKLIIVGMPEPEIVLPRGTELIVRVEPAGDSSGLISPPVAAEYPDDRFSRLPATITRQNGAPVSDLIHLALLGSEEAVTAAFEAAGWSPADPRTRRAFARTYRAFARMTTYAKVPVSSLYYRDRPPDLVFQKSFNSIAKRHHIRLWKDDSAETPTYLAAATHDIGIVLHWKKLRATHEVDPEVDRERGKVINDLDYAGCVGAVESVERTHLARDAAPGGGIVSDGRLHVLHLRECASSIVPSTPGDAPRRGALARSTRRLVLETRQYFTRGSVFYLGARGLKFVFKVKPNR